MTNEEKALNLSREYAAPKNKNREIAVYQSCIEMAEWKDNEFEKKRKQFIEKACEIIGNMDFLADYTSSIMFGGGTITLDREKLLNDFREQIEEVV